MATYIVKPPVEFTFKAPHWPTWQGRWERFHRQSGLKELEDEAQIDGLMYYMGEKSENLLKSFRLSTTDVKKYSEVLAGRKLCRS